MLIISIIGNAINKNIVVVDTFCDLISVNIYDAVFYNDHIISRYFVMYRIDEQQIEYDDFVIKTNEYKKVTKIYRI